MRQKQVTRGMTEGRPMIHIIMFSLPLVLGTLFQQLYSLADTIIVGRCIGVDALAAVGATYSLHFLIFGFIQGSCVGFSIPLSQSFGGKEYKEMRRYLWNGIWLCIAVSLILTIGTTLLAKPLLRMVDTPEDVFSMAVQYIQVLFWGIGANLLYNYSASVLRALGDAKHPFYFLLLASGLNILLDIVFIVPFGLGVFGAALATVISQMVSGILNCWWLFTKIPLITVDQEEMQPSCSHLKNLSKIGLPMGIEYSVSALGAIMMQSAINSLGSYAVAAQTTGDKIRQMFTLPMESVGMAMATYVGHNYGAKKFDRIRQGIRSGLLIQIIYCMFSWGVLYLFGDTFVRFVLGEGNSLVSREAIRYLAIISTMFILHGSLMIFRNTLQGMGYSMHAIISGVGELLGRGVGGYLAIHTFGFTAICYANPLAWAFALVYCVVIFTIIYNHRTKCDN